MNILVLSPHRDDAAFSLCLSITSWLRSGHRVTLLNVFTRSLYAPYSDVDSLHQNDRVSYVSAMRKREDEAFQKQFPGLNMIDLNIKDAPLRLRCDSSAVCGMPIDPNDPAIPKVREAVAIQTAKTQPNACVVVPLALGHHVDHRVVRDAALPLTTKFPCAFYEDLPYASREGVRVDLARFREDAATRFHEPLSPVLCHRSHTQPTEHKLKIALLYASQIDRELATTIANFSARYHGAERLWANEGWLGIAEAQKLSTPQRNATAELLPA